MNDQQSPQPQPFRFRWRWFFLALLLAALVSTQVYRLGKHKEVNQQLAAFRLDGFPTDAKELEAFLGTVPDPENAAVLIMEAVDQIDLPKNAFDHPSWGRGEELAADERDDLRAILTNNVPVLQTLHRAAQLKKCQFPINFRLGPAALLPHLAKVKSLTQLCKAQSVLLSEEGQVDQAVASICDGFRLGQFLDTEPLLISQLVRIACLAINCTTVERVINQHALSEQNILRLTEAVRSARESSRKAFQTGFFGETTLGTYFFRAPVGEFIRATEGLDPSNPNANSGTAWAAQVVVPLYHFSGLKDRDFSFYLNMMHGIIKASGKPFPESIQDAKTVANNVENQLQQHRLLVISRLLLPALQRSIEKSADLEARLRTVETALAIEKFRAQSKGALPSDLASLTPQFLPTPLPDPFSGAPLHYLKMEPGYLVYSLGPDGTDEKGQDRHGDSPVVRKWPPEKSTDSSPAQPAKTTKKSRSSRTNKEYDIPFVVER